MDHRTRIEEALELIFQGIGKLKEQLPGEREPGAERPLVFYNPDESCTG